MEQSDPHQRRIHPVGRGAGHDARGGYDDTCVGYASQRRTPRHGNGGRHIRPMERLPAAVCIAFEHTM